MKLKLGHHLICEATSCDKSILNNEMELVNIMLKACLEGGATVLGHTSHSFEPQGVTVVVGLSESHASIHTWPEHGYAMLDVCTCGEHVNPMVIFESIKKELKGNIIIKELERGIPKDVS
jgi:S-adenosylmethionine decarboxylase